MRIRNETAKDIAAEKKFTAMFRARRAVGLFKLSDYYIVDFAVYTTGFKVTGFLEYKRRYNPYKQYPDLYLSLQKWMKLREYTEFAPTMFWVEYDDQLMYIIPKDHTGYEIELRGRDDRGQSGDIEPIILIKKEDLKLYCPVVDGEYVHD